MDSDDLDLDEVKRRLPALGARPSRSAQEAWERELAAIKAMSAEERVLLALRLGRRDRALLARDAANGPRR